MASSIGVSVRINGDICCSKVATDQDAARLEVISSIRYDDLLQHCIQNTLLSYDDSIDPSPFYMLSYHRDRMLVAVDQLGWTEARSFLEGSLGVVRLKQVLQDHLTESYNSTQLPQPLKIRVTITARGHTSATSTSLPVLPLSTLCFSHFPPTLSQLPPSIDHPTPDRSWRIFISTVPVYPSFFTRHKTTERAVYDKARSLIPTPLPKEPPDKILSEMLIVNHDGEIMEGSITTPYFWRRGRWVTPPASAGGNMGTTRRFALEAGICFEETVPKESIADGEAIWLSNGARGWGWGEVKTSMKGEGPNRSISTHPNHLA